MDRKCKYYFRIFFFWIGVLCILCFLVVDSIVCLFLGFKIIVEIVEVNRKI